MTRAAADAGPLLQQTAAAARAWLIATHVVKHHEPFFAPIAAMVAMNASPGERGSNALRLLVGVFVGIGAGELCVLVLGRGYGTLGLATLTAMVVARAIGGARIVTAQAGKCRVRHNTTPKGGAPSSSPSRTRHRGKPYPGSSRGSRTRWRVSSFQRSNPHQWTWKSKGGEPGRGYGQS